MGVINRPFKVYGPLYARSEVSVNKRNYKVYVEVGLIKTEIIRYLSILDTEAGQKVTVKDNIAKEALKNLRKSELPVVRDANEQSINSL